MPTLVIHAPYSKGKPGTPNSFETYLKTGIGKGYAIFPKDVSKLPTGCKVVLLRKDRNRLRAEGLLARLVPAGRTPQGIQRYDVYFEKQTIVPYGEPEKLNHFGIAVLDC